MPVLKIIVALSLVALAGCGSPSLPATPTGLGRLNAMGRAAHDQRRLNEASEAYAKLLQADVPRPPTPAELELVRRCCPLFRRHREEFFPLEDFVALLHPRRPWIGFHLFWDDDVDFPDDNDPTDHEVI